MTDGNVSIEGEPYSILSKTMAIEDWKDLTHIEALLATNLGETNAIRYRKVLNRCFAIGAAYAVKNPTQVAVIE